MKIAHYISLAFALSVGACTTTQANQGNKVGIDDGRSIGVTTASYYGPGFHGRKTANGERFNKHAMTAAHKSLPFGSRVVVTNLRNNRSVIVRINDRGPFVHGRGIDLSEGAARSVGLLGTGKVKLSLL